MATTRIRKDGYHLSVVCAHPTTPASGDPVRYGDLTGVALTDESEGGNASGYTSVDFGPSVWDLVVDDNEGTGIAVGDKVYYHDTGTGTPTTSLNNSATSNDAFFGVALEAVGANATTRINVLHVPTAASIALANNAVDTAQIADNAVTNAKLADAAVGEAELATALAGTAAGLGVLRVARATFDPTTNAGERTIAAHGLGVTIPDNAVILGGFYDVVTTFQSAGADAGTIALHAQSANDLVTATAISAGGNIWDAGLHAITPDFLVAAGVATGIKLTAARELTATVASQALTAGKLELYVYYVQSS